MKIGGNADPAADWGDTPDPATMTEVRSDETSLSAVASRLGVSAEELQKANPQIADPKQLTAGTELRVPAPAVMSLAASADADSAASAVSKRMEGNLDAALMRASLSAAPLSVTADNFGPSGSSGGITQMPPVADPVAERAARQQTDDLKEQLGRVYRAAESLGVKHDDIVSMLHTLAGNQPVTPEMTSKALHLFFMAADLPAADRKAVDEAFARSHGDPDYVDALSKLIVDPKFTGASSQVRQQWLQKFQNLAQSPELNGLNSEEKSIVLHALASDPPPSADKIKSTLDVMASAKDLSPADRKLFMDGLNASGGDPAYAANLKKLIEDPKFKSLKPAEKTAVLSQTKNYADARAVANIDRLLGKNWFRAQDLGDKQRTLKVIGRLSQYPTGDRQIIDNTLDKVLEPGSHIRIEWANLSPIYGDRGGNIIRLNSGGKIVPAGNDKLPENDDTNELAIATLPHEVNHYVNDDAVAPTFKYFQEEYRAWYVDFKAEHGRAPTNQEAMERNIAWQLNPESAYGKSTGPALKNPKEAEQFYRFLESVTGMKVNAKNWKDVVKSDPATWPDKGQSPAPVASGNIDNH